MEIYAQDIIISLINIVVLFVLLRMILWKYVIRYLSERQNRIRKELDDAEATRAQVKTLEDDYKQKISQIDEQGQKIIQDSIARAEEEAEEIQKETKNTVDEMLRDAKYRIELEHEQSLKDAQAEIVSLATEMAANILGREVSNADNTRVVDDFFDSH